MEIAVQQRTRQTCILYDNAIRCSYAVTAQLVLVRVVGQQDYNFTVGGLRVPQVSV